MEKSALGSLMEQAVEARHELAISIGYFSIEFANMESKLNALIHELLGLEPDTGHALTSAIMNVSARMDILTSLGRELEAAKPYRKTIEVALKDAISVNGFRNWLLHDSWAGSVKVDDDEWRHQKRRMRPKGGGRDWQHNSFTQSQIITETARCAAIAQLVQHAIAELSAARVARKEQTEQTS